MLREVSATGSQKVAQDGAITNLELHNHYIATAEASMGEASSYWKEQLVPSSTPKMTTSQKMQQSKNVPVPGRPLKKEPLATHLRYTLDSHV